eukprot:6475022-Prorocentrum_lima.AAC.1
MSNRLSTVVLRDLSGESPSACGLRGRRLGDASPPGAASSITASVSGGGGSAFSLSSGALGVAMSRREAGLAPH